MATKQIPYWWLAFRNEEGTFAGACVVQGPNLKSALIVADVTQLRTGEPYEAIAFTEDIPTGWTYRRLTPDEVREGDADLIRELARFGSQEPILAASDPKQGGRCLLYQTEDPILEVLERIRSTPAPDREPVF